MPNLSAHNEDKNTLKACLRVLTFSEARHVIVAASIRDKLELEFVDTLEYENDILGESMESWLKRFNKMLTNTEPIFLRDGSVTQSGREYCRYYVCLNTSFIEDHPFSVGKYADTDILAWEDAAIVMIRRLLIATNKQAKVAGNQGQVDSESVTIGFNTGNVVDEDDAMASRVGGDSHTLLPKLLQQVESLQKRVSELEEHDAAHKSAIKLLELVVLKKKDVYRMTKEDHNGTTPFQPQLKVGKLIWREWCPEKRQYVMSDEMNQLGKKLFHSLTTAQSPSMQKSPRSGGGQPSSCTQFQSTPNTSKGKTVNIGLVQKRNTPRQKLVSIPRVMKPMFKPPTDMTMTLSEAMMFAFIFGEDMELCEPLVLTAYAMKVALTQQYYSCVRTWHLPPSFDCEALYGMMSSDAFGGSAVHTPFDLDMWPIDIARGVPNMGTRVNSSVWVLQWMLMEDCFLTNLPGVLSEMIVRIKAALMMVMETVNQQKIKIEQEAAKRWEKFT
ncbi:hypothetical protein RIF29_34771 [Crotalaria pallida]|uniref:Uncharacterized protein n=1 Tax=Crotalaria pallida TaxID=3830 RepID=A0AAN9EF51_CROPI